MRGALKAYAVHDGDESSDVVFAPRAASAAVKGANVLEADVECVEVTRIAWADKFCPGPVPRLELIAHGWWFECSGCYRKIDDNEIDEDAEDQRPIEPIETKGALWCCAECRDDYIADQKARRAAEYIAIAELAEKARAALPGVTLTDSVHAYVVRTGSIYMPEQVWVSFTFPGMTIAPGQYRYEHAGEEPAVFICFGDKSAWEAFRGRAEVDS